MLVDDRLVDDSPVVSTPLLYPDAGTLRGRSSSLQARVYDGRRCVLSQPPWPWNSSGTAPKHWRFGEFNFRQVCSAAILYGIVWLALPQGKDHLSVKILWLILTSSYPSSGSGETPAQLISGHPSSLSSSGMSSSWADLC